MHDRMSEKFLTSGKRMLPEPLFPRPRDQETMCSGDEFS